MAIDLEKKADFTQEHDTETVLTSLDAEKNKKQRLFAHPFSFKGRIRRLEFGLSFILYVLLSPCIDVLAKGPFGLLIIPVIWFWLAQLCKRFHDRNLSGFYIFTMLIPLYNFYVIIMQLFADGDEYENDYGPDPKGRNMFA